MSVWVVFTNSGQLDSIWDTLEAAQARVSVLSRGLVYEQFPMNQVLGQ